MTDELTQRLEAIQKRCQAKKDRHRQDVAYVQEHHPELAEFVTEFGKAFGRGGFEYRVTLRNPKLPKKPPTV